jgi:hypothetical protein
MRAWPRLARAAATAALALAMTGGCGGRHVTAPTPGAPARSWRMGFALTLPRPDPALIVPSLQLQLAHSDAAIISMELPWDSLLAGRPADSLVIRNVLPLAEAYRASGKRIVVMLDPANGLDRAGEAEPLVRAGRSIFEPAIQRMYRDYALAIDARIQPDWLGLALETNLIRALQGPYLAIVQMANDASADLRRQDPYMRLLISVQAETAWGRIPATGGYVGVDADLADFAFTQALGISSYPYLGGFVEPEDIPLDYYARLRGNRTLPVLVTEGGWSSATAAGTVFSPAQQARYVRRQALLLQRAGAVAAFQLTFTDLDLTAWPAALAPFAHLGLVDSVLAPKPALGAWDSVLARPLAQPMSSVRPAVLQSPASLQ